MIFVMATKPVGSAADDASAPTDPVTRTLERREVHLARRPDDTAEVLLDAIRAGLRPGDPVARLLAGWTAPPARPVTTPTVRISRGS